MKSHDAIRRMVQASLLTALAVALSIWPKFVIFPATPWLKLEFSDIPVLLGGFALGPWFGAAIAVLKALLNGVFTGDLNPISLSMNILSTAIPTLAAALLYRAKKTRTRAYISLGVFLVTQIIVMVPVNYYIGSLYFVSDKVSYAAARAKYAPLLGWVALFNLIKGGATVLVTGFVYKPLSRTVLSKDLLAPKERKDTKPAEESPNSEE